MFNFKYVLILLVIFLTIKLYSQPNLPQQYDDYYIVTNPDSLEVVVYQQQSNPSLYLHQLIALELSRNIFLEKLGQDFDKIEYLSEQQKCTNCSAMLLFLKGCYNTSSNWEKSAAYFIEASKAFEAQRDTIGMLSCYSFLVKLNMGAYRELIGDKNIANGYYDKIMEISTQCQKIRAKMIRQGSIILYSSTIKGKGYGLENQLLAYNTAMDIINKNPRLEYCRAMLTSNMGICYATSKDYENQLKYQQLSIKILKGKESKTLAMYTANLGDIYICLNKFKEAEYYCKKALGICSRRGSTLGQQEHIYGDLALCQFKQGKYKEACESLYTEKDLDEQIQEDKKVQDLLDIQTKYETEKKELENQRLKAEFESSEQKAKFNYLAILSLLCFSITMIWVYRKNQRKNEELLRLNERSAIQNEQLSLSNKRMTFFTRVLSHDTMNYVNNIINNVNIGLEENPIASKPLNVINRNADRLKKMTENLIVFNQINRIRASAIPINLNAIVIEASEDIGFDFKTPNDLHLPSEAVMANVNTQCVKQVFKNILDNAIKFRTPNIPVQIDITFRTLTSENKIEVCVKDNGIGISTSKLPLMFEEFTKSSVSTPGNGLGLYICQEIIESIGGKIWVTSELGQGSAFYFTLPIA